MKFTTFALLACSALAACGDDGGGSRDGDATISGDARVNGRDGGGDDEPDGEGECIPLGCDEQGYECGIADDGCGNELDCTGVKECVYPEKCGEDFKCGCVPKTCDELAAEGGAQACGAADDGCGGTVECGGCEGLDGDRWTCAELEHQCQCAELTAAAACDGRSCGTASNGCGGDVECGSCGSEARGCSAEGTCACLPPDSAYAATACGAKTCGTVVVDGCPFTCGADCTADCAGAPNDQGADCTTCDCTNTCGGNELTCCVPSDRATLCAASECGTTVVDPCDGAVYECGCAAGTACVDKEFIQGATANRCTASERAALLGAYVVRAHNFTDFLTGPQRGETVSLVRIVEQAGGSLRMEDKGCVATTVSSDDGTRSVASAYFNISTQLVTVSTPTAGTFQRDGAPNLDTTGFIPGMPSFCTAGGAPSTAADSDVYPNDLDTDPTLSSGSQKEWLTSACTCPEAEDVCAANAITQDCLPKSNLGPFAQSRDCRLNDIDGDGKAGFTVIANLGQVVAAVTSGRTIWENGNVHPAGFHTAIAPAPDPKSAPGTNPFYRAFAGCTGLGCGALGGDDVPCGDQYNVVQFRKVAPAAFRQLSCESFYTNRYTLEQIARAGRWTTSGSNLGVSGVVNQTAIDAYFTAANGPLPACSAGSPCPTGMVCNAGSCMPKTSPGACSGGTPCGEGWVCGRRNACWPVASACRL